jgi:hypothetical protein
MMHAIRSSELSVLTRTTGHTIPEDGILPTMDRFNYFKELMSFKAEDGLLHINML